VALSKHITNPMVDAAYKVFLAEAEPPHMVRIADYTLADGRTDIAAFKHAEANALARNRAFVRRILKAAAEASAPPGRPEYK
jgi:hypothetical protein